MNPDVLGTARLLFSRPRVNICFQGVQGDNRGFWHVTRRSSDRNPGSIGIVETCYGPLLRAINKIRASLCKDDATDAEWLQMAFYAANVKMGPKGLFPMVLVFGSLPRPVRSTPSPTPLQLQSVNKKALK